MVFTPASWLPALPEIPDVSLFDFMFQESVTGRSISSREQAHKVEALARALAAELGWSVNAGSEYDKVISVFALNTIDVPTVHWAIHRLNGICAPINAAYTANEVASLLKKASSRAMFTVLPNLDTAKKAASLAGIPYNRIYILEMPHDPSVLHGFLTLTELLDRSLMSPELDALRWTKGQSKRQCAYLSHSSGTSGPPKLAAVSHYNIVSNMIQLAIYEEDGRGGPNARKVMLGLVPASHVFGIVSVAHMCTYRGDSVIILPKYDLVHMLETTARYRIQTFPVVPPVIVQLGKSDLIHRYDLSSIETVLSGGAPLDVDTLSRLSSKYPHWVYRQGYGLTEAGATISITNVRDAWEGSAGSLIPGVDVKLLREDGSEVTAYDERGEIHARSPGVILGYHKDPAGTSETFIEQEDGRWLRTGDIAVVRKAPSGNEHFFIVDRVKEVLKVKGFQVVPAELESCLLTHPAVSECAVIGVPDERAGEVPKAFVRRSPDIKKGLDNGRLAQELAKLVQEKTSRHKWLAGGIEFTTDIPKSPSGKLLRRLLRDRERAKNNAIKAIM